MSGERPLRVLIVDDSIVIRRLLTLVFEAEPDIEVAGVAANGKIALMKVPQVAPDAVTLDIEMPEMDGLETLKELRKKYPKLPVVMFSTLTERGAACTLDALSLGADDYVTKPANVGSVNEGMQRIREDLVPKLRSLVRRPLGPKTAAASLVPAPSAAPNAEPRHFIPKTPAVKPPPRTGPLPAVKALCIGSSTGGPNALQELIPRLPKDLPVPAFLVQHMPKVFTKLLADRLNDKSPVRVLEAAGGEKAEPGTLYIAPGEYHMTVGKGPAGVSVALNQEKPENFCRPAVDVLFRSAVAAYGDGVLAVVLTGMGEDGFRGCEAVRAAGGQVVVQDKATSVVWGMPGVVAEGGLADAVLPLGDIAAEVLRRVGGKAR